MHVHLLHLPVAHPLGETPLLSAVGTLAPVPELGFVLQAGAVGTAVGSLVALRARRRDPDADTWAITTAWTVLALAVGALVAIVALLS